MAQPESTELSQSSLPTLSVRRLAELFYRRGGLGLAAWQGVDPLDGIRAHQRAVRWIEAENPEQEPREVLPEPALAEVVEDEAGTLLLRGRADIWLRTAGQWTLIEVKSFRGSSETLPADGDPAHWAQARLYAALLAGQADAPPELELRLLYTAIDHEEYIVLERRESQTSLRRFLQESVHRYLSKLHNILLWSTERDASLRAARFPFPLLRPGQSELMRAVLTALRDKRALFAEAPTGIGKTMAVLYPALKALSQGYVRHIFYATAMTSTRAVVEDALAILRRDPACLLRSLRLLSKEQLCLHREIFCDTALCPLATAFYDRLPDGLADALSYTRIDATVLRQLAEKHQLCPFSLAMELTPYCDVIIGDYNHIFDPRSRFSSLLDEESEGPIALLIDEAHNLPQRSRGMYSAAIRLDDFDQLLPLFKEEAYAQLIAPYRRLQDLFRQIYGLLHALEELLKDNESPEEERLAHLHDLPLAELRRDGESTREVLSGSFYALLARPLLLIRLLGRLLAQLAYFFDEERAFPERNRFLKIYFDLLFLHKIAEHYYGKSYLTAMKMDRGHLVFSLLCLDAAPMLQALVADKHPQIYFSATLSPFSYYRRLIYQNPLDERPAHLSLPSPFPPENRLCLISPAASFRYEKRAAQIDRVRQQIYLACAARRGNYLVFCPSYAYLEDLRRNLAGHSRPEHTRFLVQRPGMSEKQKHFFLEQFQAEQGQDSLIALVVLGSSFNEGIDLSGDRLIGVIVLGVGLPGISPERNILSEYFDAESAGSGFYNAYVVPGFQRVQQAVGRLIRSETDRGFLLLIDERWQQSPYRELLPDDWRPVFLESDQELLDRLQTFWGAET